LVRSYADDIALVIRSMVDCGKIIYKFFAKIARYTNLNLNLKKCVVIPLWTDDISVAKGIITQLIPEWRSMAFNTHGKYLGFQVGYGSDSLEWDTALRKFRNILNLIAKIDQPIFQAILMYHTYAVSVIQYVAQLRKPPKHREQQSRSGIIRIFKGPGLWAPASLFYNLREYFHAPIEIRSLKTLAAAIMARVCISRGSAVADAVNVIGIAKFQPGSVLVSPHLKWIDSCAATTLYSFNKNMLEGPQPIPKHILDGEIGSASLQTCLYSFYKDLYFPVDATNL